MVKRLAMLVVCLLLTGSVLGCASTAGIYTSTPSEGVDKVPPPTTQGLPETTLSQDTQVVEVPGIEARLADMPWISPAEVEVGNYYPGAIADWSIKVHNGSNSMVKFAVVYRVPDNPREGYDMPPTEAQDWVIIADTTPILSPKETKEILITLAVPEGAKLNSKKWEFWISVMEGGQGLVQTEMCERWLISMR